MKKMILICVIVSAMALLFAINPVQIQESRGQSLTLKFTAPELELSSQKVGTQDFHVLKMASAMSSPEPSHPELPVFTTSIILPASGSFTLSVQPLRQSKLPGIHPLPVFADEDDKNEYDLSKYYSADLQPVVQSSGIEVLRDFRILSLSIHPVQWDAQSSELTVYDEVSIQLNFTNEASDTDMPAYTSYSPAFRNIYAANLINFDDYRYLNSANDYGRILMIRANNSNAVYLMMIENFANWKRMKGHEVNLVNVQSAGSSSTAIKNYIQAQYDDPNTRPDYVILIGDTPQIPTFYESYSGYSGEGDYPYTFLAGNDTLGDVFIGRISVETVEQLATVLEKTYRYERDINNDINAAAWLNRILLIGDPGTSGISCVYNSKYIKELAEMVHPDYSFIENYTGGYSSTINSGFNQGVSFFSYRGWLGMSGWSPSASLVNNPRFPHAMILTCSTGNFAGSGVATSEALIRLGTSANPSGAVTAVGMATTGTHTMFNNALNSAMFNGIFAHNMRTMGEALLNGRLFTQGLYGSTHSVKANSSAHWCNLMGDPSMEVFVGIPGSLQIEAPDSLALGSTMLEIRIFDDSYNGLADVSVTAFSTANSQLVARGYTDAEGYVNLFISSGMQGNLTITAAKPDKKPASHTVYAAEGGIVYYDKILYDDGEHGSSGNSDSFAQAGETIALMLAVRNTSATALTGINASVSCEDEYIQLQTQTISFGDIPASGHLMANEAVLMTLPYDLPAQHNIRLVFEFSDAQGGNHVFPMHISAYNAFLKVEQTIILAGGNEILDPGETGTLQLGIRNQSVASVNDVSARLFSLNDLVQVEQDEAYVGSIVAGSMTYALQSFEVLARSLLIPGMQIPLRVHLSNDTGFAQDAFFNISIGSVAQTTPLGPDSYGYFIYDESDTAFEDCPSFEWIEINPAQGGGGTLLSTLYDPGTSNDEGDQNGSTALEVVNLPFDFNFYGETYDQITVCVNGFIVMGITENPEFRNCRLPSGIGPAPMIAPFWDDLIIISDAGIYQYYDAGNHQFIIEYYKLRNGYDRTSLATFQVIFYDPLYHHTSLGDGKIKIQYKDFNNVDVGGSGYVPRHGNYATIGIKDHTNTRGLEYSFNNLYPTAAAPLSNNSALLINTVPILHENPYLLVQDLIINDPNGNGIVEPGETVELGIRLINQGLNTAEDATISVSLDHPHAQLTNSTSAYPQIPGDSGAVNILPIGLVVSENCPDGSQLQLMVHVETGDAAWVYPVSVTVHKPAITISSYYMNDAQGNANGLVDPGESFDLVVNFANTNTVDAYNITANIMSMSEHVTISNPGLILPKVSAGGVTQAKYEISISPQAPLGNNLSFYLTYLGDLVPATNDHLFISIGTTGMSQDFENDNGNFQPVPVSNGWEWGSSSAVPAHSGTKLWGTRLNSNYSANANYTLSTPSIYIGADFGLEFWHYFETEANYDGGNVQVSTDSGSTWQVLQPAGGYTNAQLNSLNGPGFSGSSNGWIKSTFPLSAYGNQSVKFRFVFASDGGTHNKGWFIDDVRTSGYLEYAGKVSGQVLSSNPDIDFTEIRISSTEAISAIANADGYFDLYLPMGIQYVSATGEGYHSMDPVAIGLSAESAVAVQDFYLAYLKPASTVAYVLSESYLTLSWEAPQDPEYEVLAYEVYRRFGAAAFELVSTLEQSPYSETLDIHGEYKYYIRAVYAEGKSKPTAIVSFHWGGVDNPEQSLPPVITHLEGNYPNPFNPSTTICFTLSDASPVRLSIYNLKGQKVKSLLNESLSPGTYRKIWNARDERDRPVSSGIYLIRLETANAVFNQKAMLMK